MHTIIDIFDDDKTKKKSKKEMWLKPRVPEVDEDGNKINDLIEGLYLFGGTD